VGPVMVTVVGTTGRSTPAPARTPTPAPTYRMVNGTVKKVDPVTGRLTET